MNNLRGIISLVLIFTISFTLIGCNGAMETTEDANESKNTYIDNEESSDSEKDKEITKDEVMEKDNIVTSDDRNASENEGIPSPLSGIFGSEEKINRRPVAIMLDNHPNARWQAGLSQAEIVYEFLVEYPYTRYMGIFLMNDPEHIGPIRSSRPYFVTTLLEYDPVYVRVGGSEAAKADIKKLKLADIDGLTSSSKVFWRYYKTGKKAPNNMYSSMEAIRNAQKARGYRQSGKYEGFEFNKENKEIEGVEAKNITIRYNKSNTTKYVYDEEKKLYKRYKDGKLHVDELDNTEITAKNIIIQKARTKVLDSVGRLSIELVGQGQGMYITNGKAINITWEKKSRTSKTVFYDSSNNEIKLNPGVTWIQVTKLKTNVTIE